MIGERTSGCLRPGAATSRSAWLRSALAAAVAGPGLLPAGAFAQSAPVRIGTTNNEANADAFYAADQGYFERAGIAPAISILQNGAAIGAALAGGSLDIGTSSPFVFMNARRHGLPYTLIAPGALYESTAPDVMLCVAATSPIRSAKDLNGKIVAGITTGAMDELIIRSWIDQNGGDSTTIKVIETPTGAMADAIEQGRVAAALIPEPALSAAGSRIRQLAKAYDAIAKTFMISVWYTTNDWAAKNPLLVRKFFDALTRASAWSHANQEQAAVILDKYTHATTTRIHTHSATKLDSALIQPIFDKAFKYKMIDAPVDARDYIWSGRPA